MLLTTAALLAGCATENAAPPAVAPSEATTTQPEATATQPPTAPTCTSPLDGLTQRQRIAQLFTVGVSSMADARNAVEQYGVGGIFLGSDVVAEAVTTDGLRNLRRDSALPLLVAIDEEGGRVSRIAAFAGPMPSPRVMAATMTPERVREIARGRGEFLAGMGVTVDFAPSLDVSDQQDAAVIGDRSFSPAPARVTEYGRAFAAGLLDAGITPVFKHFPGHGRSTGDSHLQPVTVPALDQLIRSDLRPFAELVNTPGAAVMVGHLQVPGLTPPDRPASLSPGVYDLLREGRGYDAPPYDGPVFTDDLSGMKAVTDSVPLPRAVVEALAAGADSPLWISTAGVPAALDTAEQALAEGRLNRGDLERSLVRMARLRGIPVCESAPITGRIAAAGSLAPAYLDPASTGPTSTYPAGTGPGTRSPAVAALPPLSPLGPSPHP